MPTIEVTGDLPQKISEAFADVLRGWLSIQQMQKVRRLNRTEKDKSICHSHDFCDANMAMDEAFQQVLGLSFSEIISLSGEDAEPCDELCALWNKAWNLFSR